MKKQTTWLMIAGCSCIGFSLIALPFIEVNTDVADFLKGTGVVFMLAALYTEKRKNAKSRSHS